ncbi:MAG TPA: PH domain-containing protein [Methylomirabilota bacterium]|jgi:hypothetical protein|nr:PH domain-containing protein [Methylomirabilota bacterium]
MSGQRAVTTNLDDFGTTLGARERWSTLAAVGLGVVGMTALGLVFTVRSGDVRWLFLSLPLTLVLFVVGRLAPTGYRLAADGVHVERRAGPKVIPYRVIRSVDRAPRPLRGLSLTASKGVFGRFGRFWNTTLGFYRLFVTNSDGVVWLETSDGWVGLSPDRPDDFVERLRGRLGR